MNDVVGTIIKRIEKIIAEEKESIVKVSQFLSQIDFSGLVKKESNSKFSAEAIARLYCHKSLKGISNYYQLSEYFKRKPEEGFQLGFYLDEDNKLDFPPKRTFNHYLKNSLDKTELNSIIEAIIRLLTQNKKLLDLKIVAKAIRDKERKDEEKRKQTLEVTKLVKKLISPNIKIKIHHNAIFNKNNYIDILSYVALHCRCVNGGIEGFRGYYEHLPCPSSDEVLHIFGKKLKSGEEIEKMFDDALEMSLEYIKKNYKFFRNRKFDIAFDITEIPYSRKKGKTRRDMSIIPYLHSTIKDKSGSSKKNKENGKRSGFKGRPIEVYKFLTCSIVGDEFNFIIGVKPIPFLSSVWDIMDNMVLQIKKKIKVDIVYADRYFANSYAIKILKKYKLKGIMPIAYKESTMAQYYDEAAYSDSRIFESFKVKGESVRFALVNDRIGDKHPFILINFDIAEPFGFYIYKLYSKRWGIEVSYRKLKHDFMPMTTSQKYNIRLFYFLFSCCLYNMWVMVNLFVGLSLYGRFMEKKIVDSDVFIIAFLKARMEKFDNGG